MFLSFGAILLSQCYAPETLIVIGTGHSQMSGRGSLGQLPSAWLTPDERILNFTNGWTLTPALEPIDAGPYIDVWFAESPGVGPHMAFGRYLLEANACRKVILVPCARGGATAADWADVQHLRNRLYGSCFDRVTKVRGLFQGAQVVLLHYTGENDDHDAAVVAEYATRTQALFDAFRGDLGISDMLVLYVQLQPTPPAGGQAYWQDVRAAQATLQRTRQVMVTAPNGPYVDSLHLATPALLQLGQDLVTAYLDATN